MSLQPRRSSPNFVTVALHLALTLPRFLSRSTGHNILPFLNVGSGLALWNVQIGATQRQLKCQVVSFHALTSFQIRSLSEKASAWACLARKKERH